MGQHIQTIDMELALVSYFALGTNLIVPNVSWGMFAYECDLVVLTKSGYLYEIEIKISLSDLKKDCKKYHNHDDPHFKYLYFAIPFCLAEKIGPEFKHIPNNAGVIIVTDNGSRRWCKEVRKPKIRRGAPKTTIENRYKLARLGALRIWSLKQKIRRMKKGGNI